MPNPKDLYKEKGLLTGTDIGRANNTARYISREVGTLTEADAQRLRNGETPIMKPKRKNNSVINQMGEEIVRTQREMAHNASVKSIPLVQSEADAEVGPMHSRILKRAQDKRINADKIIGARYARK